MKRNLITLGGDWSERDDPLPDPAVLLRVGSPRCLCNNGCGHVFSSESAYDRHIDVDANGDGTCLPPGKLRKLAKYPMARDAAGVWFTPGPTWGGGK